MFISSNSELLLVFSIIIIVLTKQMWLIISRKQIYRVFVEYPTAMCEIVIDTKIIKKKKFHLKRTTKYIKFNLKLFQYYLLKISDTVIVLKFNLDYLSFN